MKKVREAIKVWYERNEANISAVAGIIALAFFARHAGGISTMTVA